MQHNMGKLYNSSAPSVIFRLPDLDAEQKILLFQLWHKYKDNSFDNSEYNLIAYITGIHKDYLGNVFTIIKNLGYIKEYKDWDDQGNFKPIKYKINSSKIEQYAKPADFIKEVNKNTTPIIKLNKPEVENNDFKFVL